MPFGEVVQVLTAGTTTDPYSGETVDSWATSTSVDVTTLWPPEPRPSSEPQQDARNSVTSGYTLYLPRGVEIGPRNRVVVRGGTYEVMGDPADWRLGSLGGLIVQVEQTVG